VQEKRACALCQPSVELLLKEVRRGKTKTQAEAAFRARFSEEQVKTIAEGDSPWKGAREAPVTIVEFADFQCPACKAAAPRLNELVDKFAGQIKLVFKHYPLPSHENAEKAARAAVAAQKQGKFWEMHGHMFQKQEALDKRSLLAYAKELGLDEKQFEADLESEVTADRVMQDRKLGDKLSLDSTPSVFINGRPFSFNHFDFEEDLDEWIALEIELRTGQAPAAGKTRAASQKVAPPAGSAAPEAPPKAAAGGAANKPGP
jgi:protein-disulfide isomerase